MSEVIQGSKSSLYIKEQIPGIADSSDSFTHQSVQNLWGGRGASDVLIHALYPTTALPLLIGAGSVRRLINVVAHGALAGDFIRINNGAAESEEVAIVKIVDANYFVIAKEITSSIGDEVFIMKTVTPTYTKDGSLSVSQGPVQFVRDAVTQLTIEDTAAPANNRPLPSKMFFQKDGVTYPVNKDTAVPANTAAIPVEIVGASGQTVTINAGDINVQLSHLGANFDSTRIGDGTNLMAINASLEATVHDADANALLTTIDADTSLLANTITTEGGAQPSHVIVVGGHNGSGVARHLRVDNAGRLSVDVNSSTLPSGAATSAIQATQQTTLDSLLTELQLKADLLETQPVSIAGTVAVSGPLTDAQLRATPVPVSGTVTANLGTVAGLALDSNIDALRVLTGAVAETAPGTDTASSGLNGRLQRIAQNITDMSTKLPTALGTQAIASSLSITPATNAIFLNKPSAMTANFAENLTLTTVVTITAPANAVSVMIQASDANGANIRVKQGGGVATTTSGMQFQPGRSEMYNCGTDLSVCSESGTNAISFQWFLQV